MLTLTKLKSQIRAGKRPAYHFFWGGPFSQWYPSTFIIDRIKYNTAEQYMMAEKARLFGDLPALRKILRSKWPKEQKEIGRQIKNYNDAKWAKQRVKVVIKANLAKFSQNPRLLRTLLATKTDVIVEASPEDPIWGIKLGTRHPDRRDPFKWKGKNLLGFALMEVRDILGGRVRIRKNPRNLSQLQIIDVLSRNPDIKDLKNIGSGAEADVYYINIIKNTHVFDHLIKKGEYAVKLYDTQWQGPLSEKQQKHLVLLSKYGLIPEIFYLDSNMMIMKYINGITLDKFSEQIENDPQIMDHLKTKYLKLIGIWKKLGFEHRDVRFGMSDNILVTEDLKLYIIDPYRGARK